MDGSWTLDNYIFKDNHGCSVRPDTLYGPPLYSDRCYLVPWVVALERFHCIVLLITNVHINVAAVAEQRIETA